MTRRGTTPIHKFWPRDKKTKEPIDLRSAEVVYMTYKQDGRTVIEKTKDDMEITEDMVTIHLSQLDTLALCDRKEVEIQCRVKFPDQEAPASCIIRAPVCKILKEGVI